MRPAAARRRALTIGSCLLAASAAVTSGCAPRGAGRSAATLRAVPMARVILLAPEVELTDGGPGERGPALERRLWAALDEALTGGGRRADVVTGTDSVGAGAGPTERVQRELAASPVHVHRELVGTSTERARRRLAADDVREIARIGNADGIVVARMVGRDGGAARRVAESAASLVSKTAAGALRLSPSRVVRGLLSAGDGPPRTVLRVVLVRGDSGEILWASSASSTRPPSLDVIDDLVEEAIADFPPLTEPGG